MYVLDKLQVVVMSAHGGYDAFRIWFDAGVGWTLQTIIVRGRGNPIAETEAQPKPWGVRTPIRHIVFGYAAHDRIPAVDLPVLGC